MSVGGKDATMLGFNAARVHRAACQLPVKLKIADSHLSPVNSHGSTGVLPRSAKYLVLGRLAKPQISLLM